MKFSLARTALALAATLGLASCGAGGKATFPVHVTVYNVLYEGLVLSTNGMDYAVHKPAKDGDPVAFVFPKEIEYGEVYDVIPKGASAASIGSQPAHQTCGPTTFPKTGTAGQLAKIDIYYSCSVNTFPFSGTVKGLTGTGLTLANGSNNPSVTVAPATDTSDPPKPTGADVSFLMTPVPYGSTYGLTILTQPTGQTCRITAGGENGMGVGTMDEPEEKAGGVKDLVITCVNN